VRDAPERLSIPVLPSVDLTLATEDFDVLVAYVERYQDVEGIDVVDVRAGQFWLSRDEGNDNVPKVDARMRFVQRLRARLRLTGALVSGRVPLVLCIDPGDQAALERFVATDATALTMGWILIGNGSPRGVLAAAQAE
jgi:hypothetical protein